MAHRNDAKYVLIAFLPLCALLGLLVVHYRATTAELVESFRSLPDYESFQRRNIDFTTDFYGMRYRGNASNYVDLNILYYGAYEKPLLRFLDATAESLGDDLTFVDVGANTGQHTLFASRFSAEVHAFEPYPPVLARLRAAIEMNELSNVTVHPVGLGAEEATLEFHAPPETNQGTGSFIAGFDTRSEAVDELRIVVGDEYFGGAGIGSVDLIKIDVEGYERPVLEGLRATLAEHRPVVVMELTADPEVDLLFSSEAELLAAFPEDYRLATLEFDSADDFRGSYTVSPFGMSFGEAGRSNIVAYPAELADRLPRGDAGE